MDKIVNALANNGPADFHCRFRVFVRWLRGDHHGASAGDKLNALTGTLKDNPSRAQRVGTALHEWISRAHLYPALVELGLFSRQGFLRELAKRIYERLNPAPRNFENLRHLLCFGFADGDEEWLERIGSEPWLRFFEIITPGADGPEEERQTSHQHLREQALYALEMLSIWVAAEELEPELLRLEPALIRIDSAFVALQREIAAFVRAEKKAQPTDPDEAKFDVGHLRVLLDQSVEQTARFRRSAVSKGTSIALTHLLERLDQTIERIEILLDILTDPDETQSRERAANLFVKMSVAASTRHQVKPLWQSDICLLARSISQNKSDHGEHYITHDRTGYMAMLHSAGGAGVIIAVLALIKIQIETLTLTPLTTALLVSFNYGLGFVIVHLFHFTIATKQPAMTAAALAGEIEKGERGRANQRKLAEILINVIRSQFVAVVGNVVVIKYLELRERLCLHPLMLRLIPSRPRRERAANYLHENHGALAGNFLFGCLLGMTGYIGYFTGLPLDIRHVAFSSANVGYAAAAGNPSVLEFMMLLIFTLMIGLVNLVVSFWLALWIALRARETRIGDLFGLARTFGEQVREAPRLLILPPPEMKKPSKQR